MSDSQQSPIPDILFKYVTAEGGLATLIGEHVSVMFSKPSDLNDPFEFLPSLDGLSFEHHELKSFEHLESPFLSATADDLRQQIELHWFVTSFSRARRNVRMWAQYGEHHHGICLAFDLSKLPHCLEKQMMRPVDYDQRERVDVSSFCSLSPEERGDLLKRVATQKGQDWKHEEEVRWFLRDEDGHQAKEPQQSYSKGLIDGKMRVFLKMPHSCIEQVTVGYLSDPSLLRSVLELRKMHKAHWKVAKATLSLKSFQFEEIPIIEE